MSTTLELITSPHIVAISHAWWQYWRSTLTANFKCINSSISFASFLFLKLLYWGVLDIQKAVVTKCIQNFLCLGISIHPWNHHQYQCHKLIHHFQKFIPTPFAFFPSFCNKNSSCKINPLSKILSILLLLFIIVSICTEISRAWRRAWQPTPVFLPGESHGQKNLEDYGP